MTVIIEATVQVMTEGARDVTKARVRRVCFDADGRVASKEFLTLSGDWRLVAEGARIPDECYFVLDVQDRRLAALDVIAWQPCYDGL